jgi:hypothetical protein
MQTNLFTLVLIVILSVLVIKGRVSVGMAKVRA